MKYKGKLSITSNKCFSFVLPIIPAAPPNITRSHQFARRVSHGDAKFNWFFISSIFFRSFKDLIFKHVALKILFINSNGFIVQISIINVIKSESVKSFPLIFGFNFKIAFVNITEWAKSR